MTILVTKEQKEQVSRLKEKGFVERGVVIRMMNIINGCAVVFEIHPCGAVTQVIPRIGSQTDLSLKEMGVI